MAIKDTLPISLSLSKLFANAFNNIVGTYKSITDYKLTNTIKNNHDVGRAYELSPADSLRMLFLVGGIYL